MLGKKIFFVFFIFLFFMGLVSSAFMPESYSVVVNYNSSKITFGDISKIQKNSFVGYSQGDYCLRTISFKGDEIAKTCFNFPLDNSYSVSEDCFIESGVVNASKCGASYFKSNYSAKMVYLPFSPGAKYIDVVNLDGVVLDRKEVYEFSCGNNICDSHESIESCSSDCYVESDVLYSDSEESIFDDPTLRFALVLLAIVILGFIIRAIFIRNK